MRPQLRFLAMYSSGGFGGRRRKLFYVEKNAIPRTNYGAGFYGVGLHLQDLGLSLRSTDLYKNAASTKAFLAQNLDPRARKFKLGCKWTFQQDNDPKHTSKSTGKLTDEKVLFSVWIEEDSPEVKSEGCFLFIFLFKNFTPFFLPIWLTITPTFCQLPVHYIHRTHPISSDPEKHAFSKPCRLYWVPWSQAPEVLRYAAI